MCVELVGWITLGHAYRAEDDCDFQRVNMNEAKRLAEEFQILDMPEVHVEFVNPISEKTKILITAHPKRHTRVEGIFGFVREIARQSPESYGILYMNNEEALDHSEANSFQVFVLARGKLAVRGDPFLSPIVPMIRDKEEAGGASSPPMSELG